MLSNNLKLEYLFLLIFSKKSLSKSSILPSFSCCPPIPTDYYNKSTERVVRRTHKNDDQMARSRCCLRLGAQAKCSVLCKLHPTAHIPNYQAKRWLEDLVAIKIVDGTHGGKRKKSMFFTSITIPNKELYCTRKFCSILEDGPKDLFFERKKQYLQMQMIKKKPMWCWKPKWGHQIFPESRHPSWWWQWSSSRNIHQFVMVTSLTGRGIDKRATSVSVNLEPSF